MPQARKLRKQIVVFLLARSPRLCQTPAPMPVLTEDTFILMSLVEQNERLYGDCYRITSQTLEEHPLRGDHKKGIGNIAAGARGELSGTLKRLIRYCDDAEIQHHLAAASVDWRDVAREMIADVLYGGES